VNIERIEIEEIVNNHGRVNPPVKNIKIFTDDFYPHLQILLTQTITRIPSTNMRDCTVVQVNALNPEVHRATIIIGFNILLNDIRIIKNRYGLERREYYINNINSYLYNQFNGMGFSEYDSLNIITQICRGIGAIMGETIFMTRDFPFGGTHRDISLLSFGRIRRSAILTNRDKEIKPFKYLRKLEFKE